MIDYFYNIYSLMFTVISIIIVVSFSFNFYLFRASFDIASLFLFRVKSLYKFIMTMVCYVTEVH